MDPLKNDGAERQWEVSL